MKFKDDKIHGEVFVVAEDLLGAIGEVDAGRILGEDAANDRVDWNTKVFRVEVTVYEA